ncbi:Mitochondrial zinc maintenance protein 1, mitochondrial [Vermiconidia calcicola]|uniref:Mitochondrial zinc maintenance protein 1, mitochondrial n=1 Tax=Vermiconidia calcicola TaxID=1690605 RepID=A0ACC3MWP3_9PEZI|nr:Mitochondrial zinc maintenance protein 1, mitochondrial [Vermiconidia calcicola]
MASRYLSPAEIATNRFAVLATYRHLLRATGIAFKGDSQTLLASRTHARQSFTANRSLEAGGTKAAQGVEHAQGVTKILREHVVQGTKVGEEQYKLNIHEHTQRLDNDVAGTLKGTKKSFKEIKDSVF